MPDREMIVKWFEFCRVEDKCSTDCPYWDNKGGALECTKKLANDVLTLLKEQEAEIERLKRPDCEHANHDGAGCLGYCGCEQDDEPIDACKQCEKYTGNKENQT